jgi:hypothetical protein
MISNREKNLDSILVVECDHRMRFFGDEGVTVALSP